MPGSVQNAAPAAVLPPSLSRAFVHSREFSVSVNEFMDGSSQRGLLARTSRKCWRLVKRLMPAKMATLRAFCEARKAAHEALYLRFLSQKSEAALPGRLHTNSNSAPVPGAPVPVSPPSGKPGPSPLATVQRALRAAVAGTDDPQAHHPVGSLAFEAESVSARGSRNCTPDPAA